jgi:hypothetical protein
MKFDKKQEERGGHDDVACRRISQTLNLILNSF